MAERRMFSKAIINSAKFIKMPMSTQLLYFHLALNADDDGVVEAFNVMRMTGCAEDDLKVLVLKGFVKVLNEDLVTFIIDWQEHNFIRADRKIDSKYKYLLLEVVPEIKLLEAKERSDLKKNVKLTNGQSVDGPWTDNGQSVDGPWTDNGQSVDGIGKDSIGKDRLESGQDSIGKEIIDYLNMKTGRSYRLVDSTLSHIRARLRDGYTIENFKAVIDVKCSQWLNKPDMAIYLRPVTLFGTKFDAYLQEVPKKRIIVADEIPDEEREPSPDAKFIDFTQMYAKELERFGM